MPGPAPKNPATRQRRNRVSSRAVFVVTEQPRQRTPPLPPLARTRKRKGELVQVEEPWHPMAVRFWTAIWASALKAEFLRADEAIIYRWILLTDQFWKTTSLAVAKELRLIEVQLGLTPMARRQLQWMVDRADAAEKRFQERNTPKMVAPDIVDMDPRKVLSE